jgi:hypothetical protein
VYIGAQELKDTELVKVCNFKCFSCNIISTPSLWTQKKKEQKIKEKHPQYHRLEDFGLGKLSSKFC